MNLKKIFLIWAVAMLMFMLLFSFFGPKGKQINLEEVNFKTTQSSEFYFKNMRSYFYDIESLESGGYKLYRINSREKDFSNDKLHFVLVKNTLSSQCFIRLESGMIDLDKDTLEISWEVNKKSGKICLGSRDSEGHHLFAAELYEKLDLEAKLFLWQEDKRVVFLEKEKKSLSKSLYDYFRLVGKLR